MDGDDDLKRKCLLADFNKICAREYITHTFGCKI